MLTLHRAPPSLIICARLTHPPVRICCGPGLHFCQISQSRGYSVYAGCVLASGFLPAAGRQSSAGAGAGTSSRQPQHVVSDLAWGLLRQIHPVRNFWMHLTMQNKFVLVEHLDSCASMVLVSSEGPRSWVCHGGVGLSCGAQGKVGVQGRWTSVGSDPELCLQWSMQVPSSFSCSISCCGGQTFNLRGIKINSLNWEELWVLSCMECNTARIFKNANIWLKTWC